MENRTNACIKNHNPVFKYAAAKWEVRDDGIEHCSWCGSLSPAEAIKFLKQNGTKFSGSDWKYGWPHKFYIEPVNPKASELVEIGWENGDGTHPDDVWLCRAHGRGVACNCPKEEATGYWTRTRRGHKEHLFCKFYNIHLEDATEEEFQEFSELSLKIFGIKWVRHPEKGLGYSCPKTNSFYGYQRAGVINEQGVPVHKF